MCSHDQVRSEIFRILFIGQRAPKAWHRVTFWRNQTIIDAAASGKTRAMSTHLASKSSKRPTTRDSTTIFVRDQLRGKTKNPLCSSKKARSHAE
jgi:hypothetical protein